MQGSTNFCSVAVASVASALFCSVLFRRKMLKYGTFCREMLKYATFCRETLKYGTFYRKSRTYALRENNSE